MKLLTQLQLRIIYLFGDQHFFILFFQPSLLNVFVRVFNWVLPLWSIDVFNHFLGSLCHLGGLCCHHRLNVLIMVLRSLKRRVYWFLLALNDDPLFCLDGSIKQILIHLINCLITYWILFFNRQTYAVMFYWKVFLTWYYLQLITFWLLSFDWVASILKNLLSWLFVSIENLP